MTPSHATSFIVRLEIAAEHTGACHSLDSPGAALAQFNSYEEARAFASALTGLASVTLATPVDVDALLEPRREIALIWSFEDVLAVRPDLSDDQAWETLKQARSHYDCEVGMTWDVLRCQAEMLYGAAPDTEEDE